MTTKKSAPKAKPKPAKATTAKPETFFYVFGVNESGKPRGARFVAAQADSISDVLQAMKLTICHDTSPRMTELGMKLPLGRIYARGKAFVPFIRKEHYEQLRAAQFGPPSAPAGQEIPPDQIANSEVAKSWDEVTPGRHVLAHASHIEGWWEAVIVAREDEIVTLTWRDYPEEGQVRRHITSLALTHPGPYFSQPSLTAPEAKA